MAKQQAVVTYKPHYVKVEERVKLGPVDRDKINQAVGFQLDRGSIVETRMSDNLLKATIYTFDGIGIAQKKAQASGLKVEVPDEMGVLKIILSDRLVKRRMRELVAQANLTGMTMVPVKLSGDPNEPACGFMKFLLANLANGFEGLPDEEKPTNIPVIEPVFIGAAPLSDEEADKD